MEISFAYRVQIFFVFVFGIILYLGYIEDKDTIVNVKRGIFAAAFVLVAQGCMSQYVGPFTKSWPQFWRGVARYTVLYLAALIVLLFQTSEDARGVFRYLYPELGKKVTKEMHTYDDNCELTWPNFYDNLDHYYVMHLVGWFVTSLMVRDAWVLHFWSILDEILELSWQHILPHFRECWWDHIICDLMLSNTPAIHFGLWFMKKMGMREFDWLGRKGKKSVSDWDVFKNHRRFGSLGALVLVMIANFLCGFFMINSLWIPPVNFLNVYRLSVWFLLGSMAIGELHDDLETWGTEQRRKTPISNEYRWIVCGVITLESVISWKFRHDTGNIQDVPTPLYISVPWILTIVAFLIVYAYMRIQNKVTKYGDTPRELEEKRRLGLPQEKSSKTEEKIEKKAEKKVEKVEESKQKQENQKKKEKKASTAAPVQQQESEEEEEQPVQKKKEQPKKKAEPDVTEQRKNWNAKKAGQRVESPKPKEVAPPVEDEWKTVVSSRPARRNNKKKQD